MYILLEGKTGCSIIYFTISAFFIFSSHTPLQPLIQYYCDFKQTAELYN